MDRGMIGPTHLAAGLLLLATCALPALSQLRSSAAEPDNDDDRSASIDVRATLRGDVEFTITGVGDDSKDLATLIRSLGCDWQPKESGGTCQKLLRSDLTHVEGKLALAPLVRALHDSGIDEVDITLDATGKPDASPGSTWTKRTYRGKAPLLHYQRDYYTFHAVGDELPPAFFVQMGEAWKPARLAGPFLLVLIVPPLLALLLRRRSKTNAAPSFAVVWLNWILLAAWLFWFSAMSLTDIVGFALWLHLESMVATLLIGVAVYAAPPLAATAGCALILAPDGDQEAETARGRLLARLLLREGALVVPLGLFVVGGAMFEHDQRLSMASLPAAYVLYRVLRWLGGRLSRTEIRKLESGELYDRAVAIAQSAGAKLKGMYVLGSRLAQETNAYATSTGCILVTRGLVERLTRREIDGVLAHEAGHLKGKHGGIKAGMFWAYFVVVGPLASSLLHKSGLPPWVLSLPLVPCAYILLAAQISQRHEFSADARAARITGDPEGMIAGLSRLSKITKSPVDWGGFQGSILSHPSMKKRALSIADEFQLPHERALQVLRDPDVLAVSSSPATSLHYPLPAEVDAREPVYNASARASHVYWCSWGTRIALVVMLGAMGMLARTFVPNSYRAARLFMACIPLAAWLFLRMSNSLDRLFRIRLRRRIALRLHPLPGAAFVGLLPGDRVYPVEGSFDWDLGFLSLGLDWLAYSGERTRFSVARGEVLNITVQKGPLAWDRMHAVAVRHSGGTFILRRPDVGYSARQANKLARTLKRWWRGEVLPNQTLAGDTRLPRPSLPVFRPVFPNRGKVALIFAMRAGGLFVGTLIVLATVVPMTSATMMFALVPFLAPLAYLLAVCPLLLRRPPAETPSWAVPQTASQN